LYNNIIYRTVSRYLNEPACGSLAREYPRRSAKTGFRSAEN